MATRLQRASASDRMCELKNTVQPRSRSSRMSARTSRRPSGSRPDIGSSRNTSSGSLMRAWARPTRCSMPFENLRSGSRRSPPMPTRSSRRGHAPAPLGPRRAEQAREVGQQFFGGQVVVEVRRFRQVADAPAHVGIARRLPEHRDPPRRRVDQLRQQLEGGGLAGAVRARESRRPRWRSTCSDRLSSARYGRGRQNPTA